MSVRRRGTDKALLSKFKSHTVKAGVLSGATYPANVLTDARTGAKYPDPRAGMAVATIATALEYGHSQSHPRPFMQNTVMRESARWAEVLKRLLATGVPAGKAFNTLGQIMQDSIHQTITSWPADNSPEWAAKKGFNHGLIQTDHLASSINYEVGEGST